MPKKNAYDVKLRRQETGEEHNRLIFAQDEETARERAIVRARSSLGTTMAERTYGQFEILSCVAMRL
jgi:two-component sensor histidine kinase